MISLLLFNHPDHASDQPGLAFPLESQEVDHSLINLLICNTIVNFGHKNMKLLGDCLMAFVFNIAIYRTPQPALSFAFSHPCSLYTMISNYSCMFLPTNRPYSSICFDNCTLLHPKDNTGIYLITAFNWTIFQEKWSIVSMTNDKFVHIFEYTVSSQQCQALLQTLCIWAAYNTITWNSQTCISPVHPHFHRPASVIENKQWLVLSGLSAIHSKRTLHHCMRGSKSPAHRGNTQNPEDGERMEPPGLQNSCLCVCDLLAVFLWHYTFCLLGEFVVFRFFSLHLMC